MEELKISIAILLVIQAVQFWICIVLIHKISNLESDRFLLQHQINTLRTNSHLLREDLGKYLGMQTRSLE
jgi:hypothetical protein